MEVYALRFRIYYPPKHNIMRVHNPGLAEKYEKELDKVKEHVEKLLYKPLKEFLADFYMWKSFRERIEDLYRVLKSVSINTITERAYLLVSDFTRRASEELKSLVEEGINKLLSRTISTLEKDGWNIGERKISFSGVNENYIEYEIPATKKFEGITASIRIKVSLFLGSAEVEDIVVLISYI